MEVCNFDFTGEDVTGYKMELWRQSCLLLKSKDRLEIEDFRLA